MAHRMMMIAFIIINSGLVLLIEGLCAQISYFGFEIIGGLPSNLFLCFFERRKCKRNKQLVQDIILPLLYTHTCVLCTHMRIFVC